jgi:hypothetical protein
VSACTCRYCATPAPASTPLPADPIPELPTTPRRFLVHTSCGPQDCTLHPDGQITMRTGGQTLRCALTFEDMFSPDEPAGANFSGCRIDWDVTNEDVARAMESEEEAGQGELFATGGGERS